MITMGYSRRLALIEQHAPSVKKMVGAFLCRRPNYSHLHDDLHSAAELALIEAVKRLMAGRVHNFPSFLRYYILNALWDEVRLSHVIEIPRRALSHRMLARVPLTDYVAQRTALNADTVEAILRSCEDETDRTIVFMRAAGKSQYEVSKELGISQPHVCRRIQAIAERYDAENGTRRTNAFGRNPARAGEL